MKRFFAKLDELFDWFIRGLLGVDMVILFALTNVLVFYRYVLHQNLGGLEELPVFLLMIAVWLGGAVVAKADGHVKIDIVEQFVKNETVKRAIDAAMTILTAVSSWIFTYLAYEFVCTSIERNTLSPGLQFPMWYIHIFMLIGSLASSVYFTKNSVIKVKGVRK